jgi:hypothetical protein
MQSLNLTQHYVEPSTTPQPYQGHLNLWRFALVIWSTTHTQTHKYMRMHTHTNPQVSALTHTHTQSNEFLMQPCSCVWLTFIAFKYLIYFMWTNLYCLWLHYFVYLNISKLQSWNCKCDILVPRFLLSDLYMQIIIIIPFYIYFSLKTWSDPHLPI